jgi:putative salt-induced outer membrane protein
MTKRSVWIAATMFASCLAATVTAEEKPWTFSLGLSYLATSGNSESQTGGLDLSYKHNFDPWGLEVTGSYLKAEADGVETANRTFLGARGTRAIGERWGLFAGASALQDEFAGLDSRTVVDGGVSYKAIANETHTLTFDLGVAWNSDHLVDGGSLDYMSGLAGLAYAWKISETATLGEKLVFIPSFEEFDDWRLASDLTLEAAISAKLAVKLGFLYLYDNVPVPGFEKADTKSSASLVVKL